MARQRIVHGAFVDMVTPDELYKALPRPITVTRIRASESVELDGNGSTGGAALSVFKVPISAKFEARRVGFELGGVNGSNLATGSVVLIGPGNFVEYLRSGVHIEFGQPFSNNALKVPGIQTWGDQQGPFLQNGEVFQIQCFFAAAFANMSLTVTVEGLLTDRLPKQDAN